MIGGLTMRSLLEVFEGFLILTTYMVFGILAVGAWSIPCIGIYYLIKYII